MSALANKQNEIRQAIQSSRAPAVVRSVVERRLTYLSWPRLQSLQRACREIEDVPGVVVECGVGLGGSGVVLAALSRRPYHGYDVFGMSPPPGAHDDADARARYEQLAAGRLRGPRGDRHFAYSRNLCISVEATFASFGIRDFSLYEGPFESTLSPSAPVALAHVDCEWHDAVALSLKRLEPWLGTGSIVVVDDYFAFAGVRAATDAFLAANAGFETLRTPEHLVLRRSVQSV